MPYTYGDMVPYFNGGERTLQRRVKELQDKGLFKKKDPGKGFSEREVKKISELLGFSIPFDKLKNSDT